MSLISFFSFLLLPTIFAASWRSLSTSSNYIGRGEASFSRCSPTKLCVLAGRGIDPVSILDTETLSYSSGTPPPFEIHHVQVFLGPDSCAWLAGAWTGKFPDEDNVPEIWRYCADSDEWSVITSIPRPRGGGGAFYYQGGVYLVSGTDGGHNSNAERKKWFDRYDVQSGTWTILPDIPNPRDHFHAVVKDGKVIVAGGRDSTSDAPEFFDDVEKSVDVYNFDTGVWSTLKDFDRPRGGTFSVLHDGKVFVMGGEGFGRAWSEVDVLEGDKFVPAEDMPSPRHGAGAVSCNGVLWVAGGVPVQGGGEPNVDTVAIFDGETPAPCTSNVDQEITTSAPATTDQDVGASGTTTAAVPTTDVNEEETASKDPAEEDTSSTGPVDADSAAESAAADAPATEDGSDDAGISDATGDGSTEESASPTDQTDTEDSNSQPACFASHNTVLLGDGSTKLMSELRIGDCVKVASSGQCSPIYFFSHHHTGTPVKTIRITTSVPGVEVSVSPNHFMYANGRRVLASAVRVGDVMPITFDDGKDAIVTSVEVVESVGLHNPHTLHGEDIVVNGMIATTTTSALHPTVGRMLLLPFKTAFRLSGAHPVLNVLNRAVLRTLDSVYWNAHEQRLLEKAFN